jgi:hypothetical protein
MLSAGEIVGRRLTESRRVMESAAAAMRFAAESLMMSAQT